MLSVIIVILSHSLCVHMGLCICVCVIRFSPCEAWPRQLTLTDNVTHAAYAGMSEWGIVSLSLYPLIALLDC